MNIFQLLLYCTEILGVLLFIPGCTSANTQESKTTPFITTTRSMSDVSSSMSNTSPTAVLQFTSSLSFSSSPGPKPTTTTTTATTTKTTTATTTSPTGTLYIKECRPVYIVSAGLIIACAILLVSTLCLACRTCQLSRRIRSMNTNSDLISNSEYWMGTAKKNKSKPETEAKETSVLMSDLSQTQEEMSNGTAKEDGGKVKEDGQKEEAKEVGDAANGEEVAAAPVTVAENSSSSKPQEETDNSQSAKAAAASSSEGTEEPKDVL